MATNPRPARAGSRADRLGSCLRPWAVLLVAGVLGAAATVYGGDAREAMSNGPEDFEDLSSESATAEERLAATAGAEPEVVAFVEGGDPRKTAAVAVGIRRDPAVATTSTVPARAGGGSYVLVSLGPAAKPDEAAERLHEAFADRPGVALGGEAMVAAEVGERMEEDAARAELLAFPVLLVLLLLIFRGAVAALLPLAVGGLAVALSLAGLRLVSGFAEVSVFSLNVVLGLGLGLAVDYSLLVVSRYREEIARGSAGAGPEALRATLSTAGRTVIVSALTVAAAMSALLLFPLRFLYSLGVGGVLVSLSAAAAALVVLSAMLALLGTRVNALSLARRPGRRPDPLLESSAWYRLSRLVMRRPAVVALAATALLLALAAPAREVEFVGLTPEALPPGAEAREVADAMERDLPGGGLAPVHLAVRAPTPDVPTADAGGDLARYADGLREMENVRAVEQPRPVGEGLWRVDVRPETGDLSAGSRDLVAGIRDADAPYPVEVGGPTARFHDQVEALMWAMPTALSVVVGSTLVLLFLATRSVILPFKQLVMNALTVAATFGVLVWVFQYGHLEGQLGFDSVGAIGIAEPAVICVLAFALSTDYGVFLLSRIRQEREEGAGNEEAVARGVGRTGGIVTAAALLFCVAVGAFATSEIVFVKTLGLGAALAVALDATVVRALLVPSLMRLLGGANWWIPSPLRSFRRKRVTPTRPKGPSPEGEVLEELRMVRLALDETNRRLAGLERRIGRGGAG